MSTSAPEADPRRLAIAAFARDTLGCGCPAEVFADIAESPLVLPGLPEPARRIAIGGRLLIYLVDPAEPGVAVAHLAAWAAAGLAERDRLGMNRLRLVIIADDAQALSGRLQPRFDALPDLDGRLHLHVLPRAALAGLGAL